MVPNNRIRGFWFNSPRLNSPHDFAGSRMTLPPPDGPPLSPEEIRFHAMLHQRLMALQPKRSGVWSKIWRFFAWGD
jgi:hypothetical protein